MTNVSDAFNALFSDANDIDYLVEKRPLLAHYTSINTLEKIIESDEIWFSNPLFMNDMEEVRFGVTQGAFLFRTSEDVLKAAKTKERAEILLHYFDHYFKEFDSKHALDVYVFCLSEHDSKHKDGLLSMWRGYGGQGAGAALIFNTSFVSNQSESPLIIGKVRYGTSEERIDYLGQKLKDWCRILESIDVPDDSLYLAAWSFFSLVKLYALMSKHSGFHEEKEWRIIYTPDRDPKNLLKSSLSYSIGKFGVEPRLKLKIEPLDVDIGPQWKFEDILEKIILGPSASNLLAQLSVKRMLESHGKINFSDKVVPSVIPLRSLHT